MRRTFATCLLIGLSACGAPDAPAPGGSGSGGAAFGGAVAAGGSDGAVALGGSGGASGGASGLQGGAGGGTNPPARPRCQAPAGTATPDTIEQAVALLNALPKPTSVACFVETLPRPLIAFATNSPLSAQPAVSSESPRVFLKTGQLWSSIVLDGPSSELLEFGYLLPPEDDVVLSVKGELEFPITEALSPGAPYDHLELGGGSECRLCHYGERLQPVPGIDNAFASIAFRPIPNTRVPIDSLRTAHQLCDVRVDQRRCEMLSALFDGGVVEEGAFPEELPTFF